MSLYEPVMEASFAVKQTVGHLHGFLRKIISAEDLDKLGGPLAQLASGKAVKLKHEYDMMCIGEFNRKMAGIANTLEDAPEKNGWAAHFRGFIALLLLTNSGQFIRRIVDRVQRDPVRLLRLAESSFEVMCPVRLDIMVSILKDADDDIGQLHQTTRKLVLLFRCDMELCISSGGCCFNSRVDGSPSQAWVALRQTRKMAKSDVERCESFNSIITCIGNRAPSISLPVLSCRMKIKAFLGVAVQTRENGIVSTRDAICRAEQLMDSCIRTIEDKMQQETVAAIQNVQAQCDDAELNADQLEENTKLVELRVENAHKHLNRFNAPKPYMNFVHQEILQKCITDASKSKLDKVAAAHAGLLHKAIHARVKPDAILAPMLVYVEGYNEAFLYYETFDHAMHLSPCKFIDFEEVEFAIPLATITAVDLFREVFAWMFEADVKTEVSVHLSKLLFDNESTCTSATLPVAGLEQLFVCGTVPATGSDEPDMQPKKRNKRAVAMQRRTKLKQHLDEAKLHWKHWGRRHTEDEIY